MASPLRRKPLNTPARVQWTAPGAYVAPTASWTALQAPPAAEASKSSRRPTAATYQVAVPAAAHPWLGPARDFAWGAAKTGPRSPGARPTSRSGPRSMRMWEAEAIRAGMEPDDGGDVPMAEGGADEGDAAVPTEADPAAPAEGETAPAAEGETAPAAEGDAAAPSAEADAAAPASPPPHAPQTPEPAAAARSGRYMDFDEETAELLEASESVLSCGASPGPATFLQTSARMLHWRLAAVPVEGEVAARVSRLLRGGRAASPDVIPEAQLEKFSPNHPDEVGGDLLARWMHRPLEDHALALLPGQFAWKVRPPAWGDARDHAPPPMRETRPPGAGPYTPANAALAGSPRATSFERSNTLATALGATGAPLERSLPPPPWCMLPVEELIRAGSPERLLREGRRHEPASGGSSPSRRSQTSPRRSPAAGGRAKKA